MLKKKIDKPSIVAYNTGRRCQYGRRLANTLRKEVRPLSVFEAITLMLAFAVLIIKLIEYIDKRK